MCLIVSATGTLRAARSLTTTSAIAIGVCVTGSCLAEHWAFEKPLRRAPPVVQDEGWVRNDIDRFVVARLQSKGIGPSPEADRTTLIRRVYLDLIGLPPTIEAVDSFLNDDGPDAYEKVVDTLLASPHYGERWARHWLDAARYADSNGYSVDAPRSIWKYRDWVIDALNRDLPFDRFAVEQLAGDLLSDAGIEQRIATGFHRNTMINQEGGIDQEEFRIESVIDRVNTTGTVFLGLTIACAQCHAHKYDPIDQAEYYRLFAFFNSDDEVNVELPTPDQKARKDALVEEINVLQASLQERKQIPAIVTTMALRQRQEPRQTHFLIEGDFTRKGEQVSPGVPAALHPMPKIGAPTRLDFAQWLIDPENPLTARVTVNRFWQSFFGRGIVATENDFGTQGAPPTHPELLDWLATEFLNRGWSMKSMHRLMVTSATYRQSSHARYDLADIDPQNRLLARQSRFRLDAEIIRDCALVASGKLNPTIGGPSVHPPQPAGVMKLGQVDRAWKPEAGPDRYRRGMYTYFWRMTPYPSLVVFDAPSAMETCTRRNRSNNALQALTLLNDAAFYELALGLAERIVNEGPLHTGDRLDFTHRLCLGRRPTSREVRVLSDFLETETSRSPADEISTWTAVARVLLNLDEFITRE